MELGLTKLCMFVRFLNYYCLPVSGVCSLVTAILGAASISEVTMYFYNTCVNMLLNIFFCHFC